MGPVLGGAGERPQGAGVRGKIEGGAVGLSVGLESIFPSVVHGLAGLSHGCLSSVDVLRSLGPGTQAPVCVCVRVCACVCVRTLLLCLVVCLCARLYMCTCLLYTSDAADE